MAIKVVRCSDVALLKTKLIKSKGVDTMGDYKAIPDPIYGGYNIYEEKPRKNEPLPPGCIAVGLYLFLLFLQLRAPFVPFGIITIIVGCIKIKDGRKISGWFTLIYGIIGVVVCAVFWFLMLTGQKDAAMWVLHNFAL